MKKSVLTILILSLFVFSGCFGGEETDTGTTDIQNFTTYNASAFSIGIPSSWEVLEPKDFASNVPSSTQVIFRDNVKNDIFTSNANISKEVLNSPTTTLEFAKSTIADNKITLKNYNEISRDTEFKIAVAGELKNTIFIMFEGKESETDPVVRIVQTYAVYGTDAYITTAAYLKNSDEVTVDYAKNIVKSFKIK